MSKNINLFGKKIPIVLYRCSRGRTSRGVWWGSMITQTYLKDINNVVDKCEGDSGICPEDCELKQLLNQYRDGSSVGVRR